MSEESRALGPADILQCLGYTKEEIAFLLGSPPNSLPLEFSSLMRLWEKRAQLPAVHSARVELALASQIDQVQDKDLIHVKMAAKTQELRDACHARIMSNLGAVCHLDDFYLLTDPDYREPILRWAIAETARRFAATPRNPQGDLLVLNHVLHRLGLYYVVLSGLGRQQRASANAARAKARKIVEPALRQIFEPLDHAELLAYFQEMTSEILLKMLSEITGEKIKVANLNAATLLYYFQDIDFPEALRCKIVQLLQLQLANLTDEQLISLYRSGYVFSYSFRRRLQAILNRRLKDLTCSHVFAVARNTPKEHPLFRKAKALYLKNLMTQFPLSRMDNFLDLAAIVDNDQELFALYSRTYEELCAGYRPEEITDQLTYVAQHSDSFHAWLMTKAFA